MYVTVEQKELRLRFKSNNTRFCMSAHCVGGGQTDMSRARTMGRAENPESLAEDNCRVGPPLQGDLCSPSIRLACGLDPLDLSSLG